MVFISALIQHLQVPLILRDRRVDALFIVSTAIADCSDEITPAVNLNIAEQVLAFQYKIELGCQHQKVNLR